MNSKELLERIKYVYQQSLKSKHTEEKTDFSNHQKLKQSNTNNIPNENNSLYIEIDGNYLLFFNEVYTNLISRLLKDILKKITWPVLKRQIYFNSAIRQVLYNLVQENSQNLERFGDLDDNINQLQHKMENLRQIEHRTEQIEHRTEQILTELSDNKNTYLSHKEAKIKSGLWFNEPIWVDYREHGEAYWVNTTERILEKNFVIHSLARLYDPKNSIHILDVGAAESLLSYELASFNYSVTAIDIRPISLYHPNLKFVKSDICKPTLATASFDCVVALSTLEHIGLGHYGDETEKDNDIKAVEQINLLLKPEGIFILTVPYGKKAITPLHRIYDKESLEKLIEYFIVLQISYGVRKDEFTWIMTENEIEAAVQEHNPNTYLPGAVAMLICKKIN
jgi:2-polyprenyl-3-methyl-5-hydroxy-6-metoxy-1,4-benzoquinol methylase